MQRPEIEAAASSLHRAAESQQWLSDWPIASRPQTLNEAYEVQDALARMGSRRTCGWKVGCTSAETQELLGTDQPMVGRVFSDRLFASPAVLSRFRADMPLVEAEFAFAIRRDMPPRAAVYDRPTVLEAVESLHLAIEVVESRFVSWRTPRLLESIADNGSHGSLVIGGAIPRWHEIDLPSIAVTLSVRGEVVARGEGRRVLGDPRDVLVWICRFLSQRGLGLQAGEIVTTGTCIGAVIVPLDAPVTAEFSSLGRVEIVFSSGVKRS